MVKTKDIKRIPDLRFPEFKEEWAIKKIKDIFVVKAGGDIDSANVSKTKTDIFKYPIYANAEKDKGFYGFSDQFKVSVPSVTVAGRGVNVGIAHARDHKFYPIVRLLTLTPKQEQSIFFFQYGINQFNIFIESTGVPQLTGPQISTYHIAFPTLPEQEKIASFLSAVNKKIQQLTAKKELLEQYKKGVMQKIFSREIRFTDENGKDYPDWEEKKLGDLFEISAGGDIDKKNFSKVRTEVYKYPVYANSLTKSGLHGYSNVYKIDYDCITVTGRGSLGNAKSRLAKFTPIVRLLVLKPVLHVDLIFFENKINKLKIFSETTGVPQLTAPQLRSYKVEFPLRFF